MTQILLARHGEPDWNNADESRDPGLTPLGRDQAQKLGRWLALNGGVEALYSSPLRRALETAQLAAQHLAMPVQLRDGLREWHLSSPVVAELPHPHRPAHFADPFVTAEHNGFPGLYVEFAGKVRSTLNEIAARDADRKILLVCHGGVIGQVFRNLLGNHSVPFHSDFTGVSRIFFDADRWVVGYINRLDHLISC